MEPLSKEKESVWFQVDARFNVMMIVYRRAALMATRSGLAQMGGAVMQTGQTPTKCLFWMTLRKHRAFIGEFSN